MKQRNTVRINLDDFATLSICAIRYCQGRQTYMPSLVQGIVRGHLKELPDETLTVMLRDCEEQERYGLYGSEVIDKPGWIAWKEALLNEQAHRNDN